MAQQVSWSKLQFTRLSFFDQSQFVQYLNEVS